MAIRRAFTGSFNIQITWVGITSNYAYPDPAGSGGPSGTRLRRRTRDYSLGVVFIHPPGTARCVAGAAVDTRPISADERRHESRQNEELSKLSP